MGEYGDKAILGGEAWLSVAGEDIGFGEAAISISRTAVAASRAGKWSDYKRPGKVDVTGSISRLLIDGTLWNKLLGGTTIAAGTTFSMIVSGSHNTNTFVATINKCFFTSGEITCGDADTFVEEPHDWAMQDPDEDFTLEWV